MQSDPINIPSEAHCSRMISALGMLDNIAVHCLQVCRVSLFLTDHLSLPGLNRELIRAAALLHDKIVPLSERMGYILEKYGNSPERKRNIFLLWEKSETLEKRLFAGLPFSPDDLKRLLSEGRRSSQDCQDLPQSV